VPAVRDAGEVFLDRFRLFRFFGFFWFWVSSGFFPNPDYPQRVR
jgi:hypothetical protein